MTCARSSWSTTSDGGAPRASGAGPARRGVAGRERPAPAGGLVAERLASGGGEPRGVDDRARIEDRQVRAGRLLAGGGRGARAGAVAARGHRVAVRAAPARV